MLLTSAGLTVVSLLILQRSVERQVRSNLRVDLANSVETFGMLKPRFMSVSTGPMTAA